MLYPPGTLIFELPGDAEISSFMVDSVTFEKPSLHISHPTSTLPHLNLHCWAIDYDGVRFGRRAYTLELQHFSGSLEISKLRYVPEKFLEDGKKGKGYSEGQGTSILGDARPQLSSGCERHAGKVNQRRIREGGGG